MRRGVLSLIAIALSIPVLLGVVRGWYSLEIGALRIAVLAVGVTILDSVIGVGWKIVSSLMNDDHTSREQI